MGKHEIRLRRKNMTSRRIEGHKNYYDIMRRHKKNLHKKRLGKAMLYILFVLGLAVVLYFALDRIEHSNKNNNSGRNTMFVSPKIKNYGNQEKPPERCQPFEIIVV